jgi:hypothetical protein
VIGKTNGVWCCTFHAHGGSSMLGCSSKEEYRLQSEMVLRAEPDPATLKYDAGKPPLDLVPRELVEGAARAFGFGATKYRRGGWLVGGLTQGRILAALLRHVLAYSNGEDVDSESGLCHLDHAAACLGMLLATRERKLGADDRLGVPQ